MTISTLLVSEFTFNIITFVYETFISICLLKTALNYYNEKFYKDDRLITIKIRFWLCSILLIISTFLFFVPGLSCETKWSRKVTFYYDGMDRVVNVLFLITIHLCLFYMEEGIQVIQSKLNERDHSPNWASWKKLMIPSFFTFILNTIWPIWSFIIYTCLSSSINFKINNFERANYLDNYYLRNTGLSLTASSIAQVPGMLSCFIYFYFLFRLVSVLISAYKLVEKRGKELNTNIKKFRFERWCFFSGVILFLGICKTIHCLLMASQSNGLKISKWVGFDKRMEASSDDMLYRLQTPDGTFYFLDIHSILNAIEFGSMSFILAFVTPSRRGRKLAEKGNYKKN